MVAKEEKYKTLNLLKKISHIHPLCLVEIFGNESVMIRVNKLSKRYGDFLAVKEVSFEANKGDIVGFLGPNGAGKTTTLRMLVT